MKDEVVGIDLGTTNSLVGAVHEGRAVLFSDLDGQQLIPSVVGADAQGRLLTGRPARNRRLVDPRARSARSSARWAPRTR